MTVSRHRRPTGHDVARLAGVSQSTVSLVLSRKAEGRVSEEVQERVREASRQLGYQPNASASTLRAGRARAVGLVVPDITTPFLGRVLRGAQQEAREDLYTVMLIEPGEERSWQLEAIASLNSAAIDGMLLFVIDPPTGMEISDLGPAVLIEGESAGFPSVNLDVSAGVELAVQHLVDLGHRRIGHVACDLPVTSFKRRGLRWRQLMEDLRPSGVVGSEAYCAFNLAAGREAGKHLLSSEDRPTAIFCDDDLLAAGVMLAAHDLGLAVPAELSIVGFAGTILSEVTTPPITTVAAPAEKLGASALRSLLQVIEGREVSSQTIGMSMVTRASTAVPPSP